MTTEARYVKVDVEHADFLSVINTCNNAFTASYPQNNLAIAYNLSNTACWVKTTTDAVVTIGGAVVDIEDNSNNRPLADIQSSQWTEIPT